MSVIMLDTWDEGLQAIRRNGITMITDKQKLNVKGIETISNPENCHDIHLALVLLKSWQTDWAAQQLKICLPASGIALTLQNGLGNDEILAASIGQKRTCAGVTTLGATLLEPGVIRAHERGEVILPQDQRLEELTTALQKAGFTIQFEPDIRVLQWGKLIINAAVNPLTAIMQIPNGQLLTNSFASELMKMIVQEAANVARAAKITLPHADPFANVERVIRATAGNYPSMYQDFRRGAISEIDSINGAVIRYGTQYGVPTPVNQTVLLMFKALLEAKKQEK